MGQSPPTVDQLRKYIQGLPPDLVVSRDDIKGFCGNTSDCNAYRRFLDWIRCAGISQEPNGEKGFQPVGSWRADALAMAAAKKKAADPHKETREYHELISEIWVDKAVSRLLKELPGVLVHFIKNHPKGFVLSSLLITGTIFFIILGITYSMGRQSATEPAGNQVDTVAAAEQVDKEPVPILDYIHSLQKQLDGGNFDLIITTLNEIIEESTNPEAVGYANYVLGAAYDRSGDSEAAKAALNLALSIYINMDKGKGIFRVHVRLSRIFMAEENLAEAERHLDAAKPLFPLMPTSQQAFFHVTRANLEKHKGDLDAGIHHALKAHKLYGEKFPSRAFDALTFAATFYIRRYECSGDLNDLETGDRILDQQEMTASRYERDYPRGYYHYRLAKVLYWKVKGERISTLDIETYIKDSGDQNLIEGMKQLQEAWPDCI